jgi:hypothetical protein
MRSIIVGFTVLAALIVGVLVGSSRTTKASDVSEAGLAATINGPLAGHNVSVYFRSPKDFAVPSPIPAKENIYGNFGFIQGKMLPSGDNWLELEMGDGRHVSIPTHSIAYVIAGLSATTQP